MYAQSYYCYVYILLLLLIMYNIIMHVLPGAYPRVTFVQRS